jgi:hypothetical protein
MTIDELKGSLSDEAPPAKLSLLLAALWYDAKGNWKAAHEIAQEVDTVDGAWLHAYLHRKEGDAYNAQYWYHRANRKMPGSTLSAEWEEIAQRLIKE